MVRRHLTLKNFVLNDTLRLKSLKSADVIVAKIRRLHT